MNQLALFAGDFNGDGRADFVQLGRGKEVSVHLGRADCSFPASPDFTFQLREEPRDIALVQVRDLDGDGRADLMVIAPRSPAEPGLAAPVRLDLYLSEGHPMTRRRTLPACWALVAAALVPLTAAPSPASPASPTSPASPASPGVVAAAAPPAVETSRSGSFETAAFRLPGRLLAAAVARDAGGSFGLVVLVAEDGGLPRKPAGRPRVSTDDPAPGLPRALFFLEPGRAALKRLADALPEKLNALATLAGSDGGDDQPAVPAPPLAARLADLVDLRGDGHPILFLTIPDAQGHTQIVAVRRAP